MQPESVQLSEQYGTVVLFAGFYAVHDFMDGSGDDNVTTSTESSNVTQGNGYFRIRK